ncbi:MAG TPA: ABC transporter transmembrane domain-containing protein, partial [Gaiellales bacterium]|nr:ABC transporter transmembrane domain-containing protein [Gaiellales bacterium]
MTDVVENPSEAVTWQGKLTPDSPGRHNAEEDTGRGIKLHSAGRRLLAELVRPYRRPIIGVLLIVVAQVAATMAAPWLIGVAIDNSLPAAMRGDYTSLTVVGSALLVAALLSGWLRAAFVLRSGAIGQRVLYDLRQRGYDHMQALSVAFHERFTSGRVISRLTSDV